MVMLNADDPKKMLADCTGRVHTAPSIRIVNIQYFYNLYTGTLRAPVRVPLHGRFLIRVEDHCNPIQHIVKSIELSDAL